jgi:hypothetical protein
MSNELNLDQLAVLTAGLDPHEPLHMVNLLRFRAKAAYAAGAQAAGASGQEAYFGLYLPAFQDVAQRLVLEGIRVIWAGAVVGVVAGPVAESWHASAIVEYPNVGVFRRIVESEEYRTIADPHRRAALEDWQLIAAQKMALPA